MKVYYVETTLEGEITKEIELAEWNKNTDYWDLLVFQNDKGELVSYYHDIAREVDDIDTFLRDGNWKRCAEYRDKLRTRVYNVYLEYLSTDFWGKYENKYVGLMIK